MLHAVHERDNTNTYTHKQNISASINIRVDSV